MRAYRVKLLLHQPARMDSSSGGYSDSHEKNRPGSVAPCLITCTGFLPNDYSTALVECTFLKSTFIFHGAKSLNWIIMIFP